MRASARGLATINLTLGLESPASRIVPAQEGLLGTSRDPEESFVKVAIFVYARCAPSERNVARSVVSRRAFVCARTDPTI